ncbi:polysaccharide pyruvyl transferase family protein [Celeribacter halophilus]|uniref:polysaccharide pyruvyl transferase family protein n=1 Tax=Celeribacter halophilus TaxID=576117 RepID=UPI003A9114B3
MRLQRKMRAIGYLVRSRPLPLEKPVVLQFPVIDICNSQCQMCRIWEQKKSDVISPDDVRKYFTNPLFSEVSSVGINGGEPTLRNDLPDLVRALYESLPSLKTIALITNGYRADDIITKIDAMSKVIKEFGGFFDVMVSLDGYGEMHDRVRGKPGNFERSKKVINFITTSERVDTVRIGCTIIRENVYGLADLFDFCKERDLYVKYRLGVPHQRLYTRDLHVPYALTEQERYHVVEFIEGLLAHYETGHTQRIFYKSLIGQLVHDRPRVAGCHWQHRGATVTAKGELLFCAVESKGLGRVQEVDAEEVFFANEDHLKEIISTKCSDCNHDYMGLPPRSELQRQFLDRMLNKGQVLDRAKSALRKTRLQKMRSKRRFEKRIASLKKLSASTSSPLNSMVQTTRPRVMICGWYGTETLGDKAILGGIQTALETAIGPADYTLVSLFPYVSKMTQSQMSELEGWTISSPEEAVHSVSAQNLMVFGGGPIMAIPELAEMEALFELAASKDIPRMIAGSGVGPTGDTHLNNSIARILKHASHRVYRDEASLQAATHLGTDTRADLVAEDPAFTWLEKIREKVPTPEPNEGKTLLLGLRDFPWKTYARHLDEATSKEVASSFEKATVSALEILVQEDPTLRIIPIPMCTNHFGGDDRWFYRRLFRQNDILQSHLDYKYLGKELAPIDYAAAFRRGDALLGMRFHSLVFGLGLGIPSVALDYTLGKGKVKALADRFDIPQFLLDEISASSLADSLRTVIYQREPVVLPPSSSLSAAFQTLLAAEFDSKDATLKLSK